MGGDCLNFGCVPSKALIRSAKLAHQMRHADRYGLDPVAPGISFPQIFARIRDVIGAIEPHDSAERYERLGAEVIKGHARLVDPWTVEISRDDGRQDRLTTRAIILATGAAPFVPGLPGLETVGYLTSDTLWEEMARRERAPRRLVVLGGGPIGCELAQSFARLGSEVTQVEMLPRLLMREDEDVAETVRAALAFDGVAILTSHRALACGVTGGEKWIEVEANGEHRRIGFDDLIIAVGRAARLTGYGLEELGIPAGKEGDRNERMARNPLSEHLCGGRRGGPLPIHPHRGASGLVRLHQCAFRRIAPIQGRLPGHGLSESEAKEKGIAHEVTRYGIDDLDRAIADGSATGFVKLLTPPGKDTILGATIVGAHAGDLLAEFVFAMKHGKGLGAILSTIHTYPTLAEANKFAAGEWRRADVNPRALAVLGRFHAWRRG